MGRTPFFLTIAGFMSIVVSVPIYAEPEGEVARCLSGNDLVRCQRARAGARVNKELTQKLLTRGCELGDLSGCHALARFLVFEKKDIDAAISVASKNCVSGFVFSCEDAGYHLEKIGKFDDARKHYLRSCSGDESTLRGCNSLGKLSTETDDRAL